MYVYMRIYVYGIYVHGPALLDSSETISICMRVLEPGYEGNRAGVRGY